MVGLLILPSALLMPLQFSVRQHHAGSGSCKIPQAVLTAVARSRWSGRCSRRSCRTACAAWAPRCRRCTSSSSAASWAASSRASSPTRSACAATVIVLGVPSALIGGAAADERRALHPQRPVARRRGAARGAGGAPEAFDRAARTIPLLQLANIDFSYGPVQVLFGVDFEVRKGETLALLGTNGAGKSTVLRVISGLAVPERGVVRLNGQNITYVSPEQRAKYLGIMQLPGGHGVFGNLTVEQNLAVSARLNADRARRRAAAGRGRVRAVPRARAAPRSRSPSSLSGGQQQMLALARVLIHEPELLMIDELSLGLAPLVVQRLLEVVEELKARGQTMIIVEQSLNVAMAIADRAIFLEKGEVRFEGADRRAARAGRPRPRRVLRDRGRLMTLSTIVTWNLRVQGRHRRADHRARRDGHRARLPVEPRHQLRGRQHGRARDRAVRGHGRRARLAVLAVARDRARARHAHRRRSSSWR